MFFLLKTITGVPEIKYSDIGILKVYIGYSNNSAEPVTVNIKLPCREVKKQVFCKFRIIAYMI
jgi:hypothetical protein